jgi:hypothetical protein
LPIDRPVRTALRPARSGRLGRSADIGVEPPFIRPVPCPASVGILSELTPAAFDRRWSLTEVQ